MFGHAIAAIVALAWSVRYQSAFGIKVVESKRYWLKSINLALCYRGFAADSRMTSLAGAGKAAFFCCIYDLITDWRNFDEQLFRKFEVLVKQSVCIEAADLALELYRQEKAELLENEGLSRGPVALEFVVKVVGTEAVFSKSADIVELGTILQIVDDVLDLDEDRRDQQVNCLLSHRRDEFLALLLKFRVADAENCFPHGYVLWRVVSLAQRKAEILLRSSDPAVGANPFVDVPCRPYKEIA